MTKKTFDKEIAAITEAFQDADLELCVKRAAALKKKLILEKKKDPEQVGWARYFEFRSLYALEDWKGGLKVLEDPKTRKDISNEKNDAWMHSVGAEMAMRLGRFKDIVRHSQRAVELRSKTGEKESLLLAADSACYLLKEAGHPELNNSFAKLLMTEGKTSDIPKAVNDGVQYARANVAVSGDKELVALIKAAEK